jgi:hypothetical protein
MLLIEHGNRENAPWHNYTTIDVILITYMTGSFLVTNNLYGCWQLGV